MFFVHVYTTRKIPHRFPTVLMSRSGGRRAPMSPVVEYSVWRIKKPETLIWLAAINKSMFWTVMKACLCEMTKITSTSMPSLEHT